MSLESIVAVRYLFALRKQSFISVISLFAVCGVALGVAALIVVIGVMNGFTKDLQSKILGVNADIIVGGGVGGVHNPESLAEVIRTVPGVTGVTPFLYSEVMLSAPGGGVKGLALRGIDPHSAGKVLSLGKDMVQGDIESLDTKDEIPGLIVGAQLADRFGLWNGATIYLLSPSGTQTAAGYSPKMLPFRVVGIFRTGLYEYDTTVAYATVESTRGLLGYPKGIVSGLEVKVDDIYKAPEIAVNLRELLGDSPLDVQTWQEMNANLFAALKLEKTAMFIILAMIVLVGSFSIVTTLVMLVMQKTKDIAILMSMGAEVSSIRKIFMYQGTLIGAVGTVIGYCIGVPVALLLKKYQFIKLPKDVYPVDYLPIRLDALDLTFIGAAAFLLCFLATIYPAWRAAKLRPADALRYE
ncbi:lipoprotein-releasing ABC transporter permease subunit [Paucidesulfovibrio longus]|uniref:lipoprotein-releasing ABC transporter permease subunit n=1 Tax=Paucidesulfovibrio longus TaxID=889 RepID=UPI0003B47A01|nr:lipoprotein-releasing ABC transporter permease subunit [Paucidesulfovibrio longus]